jgi:transposase
MPKKINPELKARAVRMVQDHQEDYPSVTAAAQAVAKQLGRVGRRCAAGWCRPTSTPAGRG